MSLQAAAARYLQVKHFILEQIAGGNLPAGARVPSENELTRTLAVSRMTANRALRELAADGVPLQVEERYVNPLVAPGYLHNDFSRLTPHEFLIRVAPLQRAEHTVRALIPERRIRRLLKLKSSEACLLILRRTFSNGRIASVADLYHPGSRYELAATCQPRST